MPLFCGFFLVQNVSAASHNIPSILYMTAIRSLDNGANFGTSAPVSVPVSLPAQINSNISQPSYLLQQLSWSFNNPDTTQGLLFEFEAYGLLALSGGSSQFYANNCNGFFGSVRLEGVTAQNASDSVIYCEPMSGTSRVLGFGIRSSFTVPVATTSSTAVITIGNPNNLLYGCSQTALSDIAPQTCSGGIMLLDNSLTFISEVTSDPNSSLLQTQINQNNTMISQNEEIISNLEQIADDWNSQYEKENVAVDNIENQSPDDYSDTENEATTNIIGVISSFFAQFNNFTPTNCEVTLPFPDFLGGEMKQNICSGKDQAGEIIAIVGSLVMIGFYVPLAFSLLKMIYSEIRSFTNG